MKPKLHGFMFFFMIACITLIGFSAKGQAQWSQSNAQQPQKLSGSAAWQSFSQKYGDWSVQWNEITGTPHRAYGPSIQINGYTAITETNIKGAADQFLADNSATLGIDLRNLEMVRAVESNNRWYVSYRQMVKGIEVLHSEVELRIFRNGKVMAFGSDYYQGVNVSTTPSITLENALRQAKAGLTFNKTTDSVEGDGTIYILPLEKNGRVNYHLVYLTHVKTREPLGNFVTFVDAHSGDVRWRYNRLREYSDVSGSATGLVHEKTHLDTLSSKPFSGQTIYYFSADGTTLVDSAVTDATGQYTLAASNTDSVLLSTAFSGPWVTVTREDTVADASYLKKVGVNDQVSVAWDSTNSDASERDAFYHINLVHDFQKALDANFTGMDYSMPAKVNLTFAACNAFWDGTGVNFFAAGTVGPSGQGSECPSFAQVPGIVYHEYGHGINDKFYQQQGVPSGMINSAVHEGMSDVISAFILDESIVGESVIPGIPFTRLLKNTLRYPEDIKDEGHWDGQILAGAFWDIREATSLELAKRLSNDARYGIPDDPDTGVAFGEWYLEVLVADDDDGNLDNGSPNMSVIRQAFNAHGIGDALFMRNSFQHTPTPNQSADAASYPIAFTLGNSFFKNPPEQVQIVYSLDNFQTSLSVPATIISGQLYNGEIPQAPIGSFVNYYISAIDPATTDTLLFPFNAPEASNQFLVGFDSKFRDDFENDLGWRVGAPGDDATLGIWDRGIPEAVFTPFGVMQPGEDYSDDGELCMLTKATPVNNDFPITLDGQSTLFSPIFDLSGAENPIISYYEYSTIEIGSLAIDVSNDSGNTWKSVTALTDTLNNAITPWTNRLFRVNDYVESTSSVQLRFTTNPFPGPPGLRPSIFIVLLDEFEVLTTSGEVIVTSVNAPGTQNNLPDKFALLPNYPNPFNPETTIRYDLQQRSEVKLQVFNLLGQEVRTLVNKELQAAGAQSVRWDGKNNSGITLPSGVYIYRISAGNFTASRKMVLMK